MENNQIIERIYELCEERGWNRVKLAKESKILDSTFRNSIVRDTALSIPTIRAYCKAFGITLEQFFHTSGDGEFKLSRQEAKLIKDYRLLDNEIKNEISSMTKALKKYQKITNDDNVEK